MRLVNFAKRAIRTAWPPATAVMPHIMQALPELYAGDIAKRKVFTDLSDWRAKNYVGEMDPLRVINFIQLMEQVSKLPDGDYIEMGTQYGGTAKLIYDLMPRDRKLVCFDTFEGFTQPDLDKEIHDHGFTTKSIQPLAMETVRDIITGNTHSDRLTMVKGHVPESLAPYEEYRWRFAHLDMDLYEPTRLAIEWLWPSMVPGGVIFLHDYGTLPGVKRPVDDFVRSVQRIPIPMGDRFGSVVICR
jgi:O-methyltransferase